MSGRIRCPDCESYNVVCVEDPTAKGWHLYLCEDCEAEGGNHRAVYPGANVPAWRESEP